MSARAGFTLADLAEIGARYKRDRNGAAAFRQSDDAARDVPALIAEIERLSEGLRRLKNQDYDSGYTAEDYADAVVSGHEPSGEATL